MENLYGLIGYPIGHSMSPLMHNKEFKELGLNDTYHAFEVKPENLQQAVEGIRALGICGFNVTIPHKVAIMDHVDEITEEAAEIGAVNTVVNKNGKLIAYNTDGPGYLESLLGIIPRNRLNEQSVLIIGAGGAARAIAVSLARFGVMDLTVGNRTLERARKLADDCSVHSKTEAVSLEKAERLLDKYDVIINTTSVGMSPNVNCMPIDLNNLRSGTVISDLIYNPLETMFLKEGASRGAKALNGLEMFVNQGALAFELWTGIKPDRKRMKENVLKQLGGNQ
ncbi:shikimate dehydrogenase [Pseudalkalibacillus caeni]|uniref:Shikimate dehydrogenase (NADP(+)) n=1 Tax=Exobacillus caeni TaxID=2574798 RepID=A0A5R9F8G1_9BACL|nr:shikimate dehydrogenase [Pseudalkalibacillus caeni]TLS39331.1 shikimate dehydrogenase [Pseudalkalibacillus caeni]